MEESSSLTLAQEPELNAELNASEPVGGTGPEVTPEASAYITVVHLTRNWVHIGIFGFAILCILIGAVEAFFGQ